MSEGMFMVEEGSQCRLNLRYQEARWKKTRTGSAYQAIVKRHFEGGVMWLLRNLAGN